MPPGMARKKGIRKKLILIAVFEKSIRCCQVGRPCRLRQVYVTQLLARVKNIKKYEALKLPYVSS